MVNETPVLTEHDRERLIALGIKAMVREAAMGMDAAMEHFKTQLTIASGMYNFHRFKGDLISLRAAVDRFEYAMKLQESLSGTQVQPGSSARTDTTRIDGG